MSRRALKILWALCILLIAAQTVVAAFYTIPHPMALRFLQDATKTYATLQFQAASPIMSIWGYLCRIFHIAPLTFALKILPFVIIPACYAAYAFLAHLLPRGRETAPVMVLIIACLQIFGYQSEAFVPYTLLLGWYTGYALILHLLLPVVFALILKWIKKHPLKQGDSGPEDVDEEDDDMKHKYLNVRNLGIAFLVFAVLSLLAVFLLNRKINNLHEATENLQRSISQKGDVVEFKGALGDTCKGYVVVGNDGGLSVFFGGEEEDGPALYALLLEYGQVIDAWYLKEGEDGAYTYCLEQGIAVDHVYTMQVTEEVF